ncbi:MAG: acyl-CoA thioesterase [Bacteroidetes bacterium]|jgi:acyl-CoA thioester hydrolase|nr:MAG: acyl-CoA thioesterase [Bacteroidota bacterium]
MIIFDTQVRVRYGETDQMGYVYYGKYAEYFEVGRTELIRSLGIPYRVVETKGIMMPVADLEVHYKKAARYDDLLTIRTIVREIPRSSFMTEYEVYNESGELLVTGLVKLAFVNIARMMPVRAPDFILEAVQLHWKPS